jgi:RNA polymerase sigma-70 factor (ECF subfamily)
MFPSSRPATRASADLTSLLDNAADGDQTAFIELHRQLVSYVKDLARTLLGEAESVEDIATEVFVEVWHLAPSRAYRTSDAKKWVAEVTRRRCQEHSRQVHARESPGMEAIRRAHQIYLAEELSDLLNSTRSRCGPPRN